MAVLRVIRISSAAYMAELIRYSADIRKTHCPDQDPDLEVPDPAYLSRYVSCTGLACPETAAEEMRWTRERWGRSRFAGLHVIQAFHPKDPVTADIVHEAGCRLVREAVPGYEAVVCTHHNRPHLHNHILVGAARIRDGLPLLTFLGRGDAGAKQMGSFRRLLAHSNALCARLGLAPTVPYARRAGHWAKRDFRPFTWRWMVNADIRHAAARAGGIPELRGELEALGYELRDEPCFGLRPPGGRHFWNMDTFYSGWELQVMTEDGAMALLETKRTQDRLARRFRPKRPVRHPDTPIGDMQAAALLVMHLLGRRDRTLLPGIPVSRFNGLRTDMRAFRLLRKMGVRTFREAQQMRTALKKRKADLKGQMDGAGGPDAESPHVPKLREELENAQRLSAACFRGIQWRDAAESTAAKGKEEEIGRRKTPEQAGPQPGKKPGSMRCVSARGLPG